MTTDKQLNVVFIAMSHVSRKTVSFLIKEVSALKRNVDGTA